MRTLSIPLTQDKSALIDAEDYPLIANHKWFAVRVPSARSVRWYAAAKINGKRVFMHRLLLGFPAIKVDHRNRDGLDNRRSENLRLASDSDNCANSRTYAKSGFRGVFCDQNGRWSIQVHKNRRCVHRKSGFATVEEAAREYDRIAREVHGEFASLNFPDEVSDAA